MKRQHHFANPLQVMQQVAGEVAGVGRLVAEQLALECEGGVSDPALDPVSAGLFGDDGNDSLDGGAGIDNLFGGDGNDTLHGGTGNDSLAGDAGNDQLFGDEVNDGLSGGANDDSLFGADGNDLITGDNGNDILRGGDGNDQIRGGVGNDILRGDNGSRYLLFRGFIGATNVDAIVGFEHKIDDIVLSQAIFLRYWSNLGQGRVLCWLQAPR